MDIAPLIGLGGEEPRSVIVERLRRQLSDAMAVEQVDIVRGPDQTIAFYGRLTDKPEAVFERVSERFAALGYTAMLERVNQKLFRVLALKGVARGKPTRRWINYLLFAATVLTTMFAGLELSTTVDLTDPRWYLPGLLFAGSLMTILLSHELAHYFVAKRYGSPVSLPYFVPMPLSPFGTMGAVIVQQAPMRDRKALFDIGIAGPLAGLVVAVPLLIVGLVFSRVGRPSEFIDISQFDVVQQEGNSLLYLGAKYLVLGEVLPDEEGRDVWLSAPASPGGPVVFAAWVGLLVTALNLLPIGQLDGGHVAYALLGRRAWTLAYLVVGLLGALGVGLWMAGSPAYGTWLIWAGLGLVIGPRHPPPLNDVTRLGPRRVLLGLLALLVLIVTFVPLPLVIVPAR